MKRIILVIMSVTTLLLLISCSQQPTNNQMDYVSFLKRLTENGFQYEEAEANKDSFLSVPRKPIFVGNEIIGVYVYSSNKEMEKYSKYIDKDGCSISVPGKVVEISWVSLPHFFKQDTLIIEYIGEDEKILNFLNDNYGPEFAGYGYMNK